MPILFLIIWGLLGLGVLGAADRVASDAAASLGRTQTITGDTTFRGALDFNSKANLFLGVTFDWTDPKGLILVASPDGKNFTRIHPGYVYTDTNFRDPRMIKVGNTYYVAYTFAYPAEVNYVKVIKSTDLVNWTLVAQPTFPTATVWAPSWFYDDADGKYYLLASGVSHDQATRTPYICTVTSDDFTTYSTPRQITGTALPEMIDVRLHKIGGQYKLLWSSGKIGLGTSSSRESGYSVVYGGVADSPLPYGSEGGSLVALPNSSSYRLYMDYDGEQYYADSTNLTTWSTPVRVGGSGYNLINLGVSIYTDSMTQQYVYNLALSQLLPQSWMVSLDGTGLGMTLGSANAVSSQRTTLTISGDLVIDATTTFNGILNAIGTGFTGYAPLLSVSYADTTGIANYASTFALNRNSTYTGANTFSGAMTLATVSATAFTASNATVSGTLTTATISGTKTISGANTITGATTLSSALTVTGATTLGTASITTLTATNATVSGVVTTSTISSVGALRLYNNSSTNSAAITFVRGSDTYSTTITGSSQGITVQPTVANGWSLMVRGASDSRAIMYVRDNGNQSSDRTVIAGGIQNTSETDLLKWSTNSQTVYAVGDFSLVTAGKGLQVKEGTNAKQGTATLSAGTITVSNTSVTANSRIFLTSQTDSTYASYIWVSARTAGTSFTIKSGNSSDNRMVAYEIFEPTP